MLKEDVKSENGMDEFDILPDSSLLGQAKVNLKRWNEFLEGEK
jgi:hypothetical protein